jgi:hypothetical protein
VGRHVLPVPLVADPACQFTDVQPPQFLGDIVDDLIDVPQRAIADWPALDEWA